MISGEPVEGSRSILVIDRYIYIHIYRDLGYLCLDFVPSFLFVDFPPILETLATVYPHRRDALVAVVVVIVVVVVVVPVQLPRSISRND